MSELIQKNNHQQNFRLKLLIGVSAMALGAYASAEDLAIARESDKPTVWIELDGQLSRLQGDEEQFEPKFLALTPSNFSPPQEAEKPPRYGLDGTAALMFQPKGTDWTFSASIRFGRSSSNKHVHQQSYPSSFNAYFINRQGNRYYSPVPPGAARFTDAAVKQSESHAIVDFQVGKDVGLGLFGTEGSSSLNAGVRIAQFQSKSRISLGEDPDWRFDPHVINFYGFITQYVLQPYHSYEGTLRADRSFNGVGPSIAWKNSTPVMGDIEDRVLTFDWGVNASLLFGRQKSRTQHQTTALYAPPGSGPFPYPPGYFPPILLYHHAPPPQTRSRSVIVPNIGGFAGLSFKYPNAKISFGYKADFFFGAMDGGIDVRRTEDVGFHGPYASVSIGLGG